METSETRPIWNRRLLHGTRADCVSSGSIVIGQGGASLAVPLEQGITARASQNSEAVGVSLTTMLDGVPHCGSWPRNGGVDPTGGPLRFVPATLHLPATLVLLLDQVTAAFAIAVPLWSFTVEVT